jgi:hypothetical protein
MAPRQKWPRRAEKGTSGLHCGSPKWLTLIKKAGLWWMESGGGLCWGSLAGWLCPFISAASEPEKWAHLCAQPSCPTQFSFPLDN